MIERIEAIDARVLLLVVASVGGVAKQRHLVRIGAVLAALGAGTPRSEIGQQSEQFIAGHGGRDLRPEERVPRRGRLLLQRHLPASRVVVILQRVVPALPRRRLLLELLRVVELHKPQEKSKGFLKGGSIGINVQAAIIKGNFLNLDHLLATW